MAENKVQVGVRINESLRDQLTIVASRNGRSQNQEIAYLIRLHIEQFRKDNPEIQLDLLAKQK